MEKDTLIQIVNRNYLEKQQEKALTELFEMGNRPGLERLAKESQKAKRDKRWTEIKDTMTGCLIWLMVLMTLMNAFMLISLIWLTR